MPLYPTSAVASSAVPLFAAVRVVKLALSASSPTIAAAQPPSLISLLEATANQRRLKSRHISMLTSQGLSHADALGALLLADGDPDGALVQAACCVDSGGAAKVWREVFHHPQVCGSHACGLCC